jgi:energy-coupling factor transporter ATP-binding protein EcfA2
MSLQLARVNVIGSTGSGKSTFARRLAKLVSSPYVELDALYWLPGWRPAPDDVFFARIAAAVSGERWLLDGNYTRSQAVKWARVQTVIWLDYGFGLTLWRLLSRTLRRGFQRRELWPNTGNREQLWRLFRSDSILLWFLKSYHPHRARFSSFVRDPSLAHIRFLRLRSPRAAERFLSDVRTQCGAT